MNPRPLSRTRGAWVSIVHLMAAVSPRVRIGIAVEADAVRAVGVRWGRVLWGVECPVSPGDLPADGVATCLAAAPKPTWPMPTAGVALGPLHAQTKRLAGLPAIADGRLLGRAVQAHAGRFFLKNGIPLVTSAVRRSGPSEGWAAAFEQPTVSSIVAAGRRAHVRVRAMVPAVDVVARGLVGLRDETLIWPDGTDGTAVTWAGGHLVSVRRLPSVSTSVPATVLVPVPALSPLGSSASRFAAAYGAALEIAQPAESSALTYRTVGADAPDDAHAPRRLRLGAALAAAVIALVAAALAPALAARYAERGATRRLAELAPAAVAEQRVGHDLAMVSAALGEVAAFDSASRSMTVVLATIARALPPGVALLALHADSAGGSVVALAPRVGGSAVLAALDHVPLLSAPEIVGAVTHDVNGGHDDERVTIRFGWARAGAGRPGAGGRT